MLGSVIFVHRFVNGTVASLVHAFATEPIDSPRDSQLVLRVMESHRALCASVSKCSRGGMLTVAVRNGFWSVMMRIQDNSQSDVDHMLKRMIKLSDSFPGGQERH